MSLGRTRVLLGLGFLFAISETLSAQTVYLKINASQPGVSGPVAVRAIIKKSDTSYVSGEWDNFNYPGTMRGKAVGPDTVIEIPAGQTEITIGKGPDIFPQTISTNLNSPGRTYTINVTLQPVFDLYRNGWRGGDAHIHYNHGENQVSRTPDEAFTMLAAGGMNFASFAEEHYGAVTMTRDQMQNVWKKYDNSECKLWNGVEEPKNGWGHHISIVDDPWAIRSAVPYHWGAHEVHDQGGVTFAVHPQRFYPERYFDNPKTGQREWALYPNSNHLKSYPLDALLGYLDGWSGVSDQPYSETLLGPYFKLLEVGYRIPLLADSDCTMDRVYNGIKSPGCWMNYFQLNGAAVSRDSISDAIRNGRVMSTTGPLVLFTIDNAKPGDTLAPDGSSRTVRIQANYSFNPWSLSNSTFDGNDTCKIRQIDLFRNGEVIQTWTPNSPTADLQYTINESSPNSYYMVRVLGNENQWMAGYASPIYFDASPRARQPAPFQSLINGRLYDASSGAAVSGSVSCVRYGKTEWTIQTDSQGLFRAYVPLDAELVAKDSSGREFTQDILKYEPAYAFCHNLGDNFPNNMGDSVDAFKNIVQEMTWEFPLGYQLSGSYVKTELSGNATMSQFSINSAPSPTSGKQNTEIVMLIVDKTQVQKGDTIHYAVLFRQPQGQTPSEELSANWLGWDPDHPRMNTRYGTTIQFDNSPATLVNLGNGFYLRQGSVVVPSWVANATDTTGALKFFASVRGSSSEEANLILPLGPTKKELLVSATWDGFPASWGETGIGPCNFHRILTPWVRYSDYRNISINLQLNGQTITICPSADTAHVADADDAVFYENFYYDGQCEPQFRNVAFRDAVRGQPGQPDFSSVPIGGGSGNSGDGDGGGSGGGVGSGGGTNASQVTIQINGDGKVSPNLQTKKLVVGKTYKVTAKPKSGQIFAGWTGDVTSSNATIRFTMQENMTLHANFIPNPFAGAKGNYSGLFYEDGELHQESSGVFTLKLTDKGAFSGRFIAGGKRISSSGKFDANGVAALQFKNAKTPLGGNLQLDFAGQITGSVTGETWTASLSGWKSAESISRTNHFYTIVFPGDNSGARPLGNGFGSVRVKNAVKLRFAGALADGTKVSQSADVSQNGDWPLYVSLSKGQGALFGWIHLDDNLAGNVNWISPAQPKAKIFPEGFTNAFSVNGSSYDSAAQPITGFQSGIFNFTDANQSQFQTTVQVDGDRLVYTAGADKFSVKLKKSTGVFQGRFKDLQTGKSTKFSGALLQNQNAGAGFFIGSSGSGSVWLSAEP